MRDNDVLISVIMPVHNYETYIQEAIDSLLLQTFPYFEFIIINDGSTDNTSLITHSYSDRRLKIIDFEVNKGCYLARNIGMRMAKGKYICVMDGDDICLPKRLETQFQFLEDNPEYGMIGSAFKRFDTNFSFYKETDYETIRLLLLRFCYLLHPTCMVRKSLVERYDLYYEENFTFAADYAWQVKASTLFPITNINELLLLYRIHEGQITRRKSLEQGMFANEIRLRQINSFGINLSNIEKSIILNFITGISINKDYTYIIEKFIKEMISINLRSNYYSHEKLVLMFENLWELYLNN